MKKYLKRIKRFIIKNKLLSLLIGLVALILILGLIVLKILIFPHYRVSKYGNRLDGIESVELDNSRYNEIKNSFQGNENITLDSFRLSGKIVNIYISVKGDYKKEDIRTKSMEIINKFSEDERKFYDFQVLVTFDDDRDPMMGYKNKNSDVLDWDREGGK